MIFLRLATIYILALLFVFTSVMTSRKRDADSYWLIYATDRLYRTTIDREYIEVITPSEVIRFDYLVTPLDGQAVAFVAYDRSGYRANFSGCEPNIYAYSIQHGNRNVLAHQNDCVTDTAFSEIKFLSWSRDSEWLVYDHHPSYLTFTTQVIVPPRQIHRIRIDGTEHQALTNEIGDQIQPAWSPDGKWIAYISQSDVGSEIGYLMRMRPDGSHKERLIPYLGQYAEPVWSPDGEWLYFRANIANEWNILRLNVSSGFTESVTAMRGNPRQMTFSPDGDYIAFVAGNGKNADVYIMRPDGSDMGQITDNTFEDQSPIWSPNQKWIAFISLRSQDRRLHIINPDGTDERHIASAEYYFSLSPAWLTMPALKWNRAVFPRLGLGFLAVVIIVFTLRHFRRATLPAALRIG